MNIKKRAIGILRVSTDSQDCERQRTDLDRNKAAYDLQIVRTLELEGVSGRKVLSHREVQRVLSDLQRPDVDGVSISALDRLFRLDKFSDFAILDPFRETGKMIWSAKEGALDLRTDSGLIISLMSGAQSGLEWRELRRRTAGGREILRQRGGCPNGRQALPRGVDFEPIKDAKGRSIGARWFYVEPYASQVRKAYDLLFERRSWHDIAERLGGSWSFNGIRVSLMNPIWKGTRRYTEGREKPLELKVIDPPLISAERWQTAQAIILEKRTRWAKTKRPQRFLLSGLLRCACGKCVYVRCGSRTQPRSYYYCSSYFPGRGPQCGGKSVRQTAADQTVEEIVSTQLLDAAFLKKLLAKFQAGQPARDQNVKKLATEREKLEEERQKLLRMTLKGTITEDDFSRESKRIEQEICGLDRLAPLPLPAAAFDLAKVVVHISRTFARFAKQPIEERRNVLRMAFREIVLDNGTIPAFTLNGAFFDSANSLTPLSWR